MCSLIFLRTHVRTTDNDLRTTIYIVLIPVNLLKCMSLLTNRIIQDGIEIEYKYMSFIIH